MAKPRRNLNTKKLMKQCQKIAASQKPKDEPKKEVIDMTLPEPVNAPMTPAEMERYLTDFLSFIKDADRRYNQAIADEQWPNSAIQDVLHAAEFAPSMIKNTNFLAETLTALRQRRREAKKELEVTEVFKAWADENRTAINKLEQALGQVRKVLARQPNDMYCFKTDIFGTQGQYLQVDAPEINPDQISMEDL